MSIAEPAEPRIVGFFILTESLMGNLMCPNPPPGKTNWFAQFIPKEIEARQGMYKEGPVADFIRLIIKDGHAPRGHMTFMGSDNPTLEEICQLASSVLSAPHEEIDLDKL